MYKELIIRKNSKQQKFKQNQSKKSNHFQQPSPLNYVCHQKQISPWESLEHTHKNETAKIQQSNKLADQNELKRSLQLKKINNFQLFSRPDQLKASTKISKEFLQLIKKQKQKGPIQSNLRIPFQIKKVAKIQMRINQDRLQESNISNKNSQSIHRNPEQKYSKQKSKNWPIKVKIQKKLTLKHKKKLSHDDFSYFQHDYSDNQPFLHPRQFRNNFTSTLYQSKLKKQKPKSNQSPNQKSITLRDYHTLYPITCRGDIVSHQQSKAARKYKFRNQLAIQLRQLDNQSFLYKL